MGIDKGILAALADHKQKVRGPHFIFSAERPMHPNRNELKLGHDQLLNHLFNAGYDAHEIRSNYGSPQRSIIVYQVDNKLAEELHQIAAKLGQGHSIYSDGHAHEMRFHHGANAGRSHYGEDTNYYEQPPVNNFTSLPGACEHFDHQFDYSSHHLSGQLNKWGKREQG